MLDQPVQPSHRGEGVIKNFLVKACFVWAVLLLSIPAYASPSSATPPAARESPLNGLSEIGVVLDGIDSDAKDCGITEPLARESIEGAIGQTNLKIVTGTVPPKFYLNVNTLRGDNGLCITSVTAQVYNYQEVTLEYSDHPTWATVELWAKSRLVLSSPDKHADQIKGTIEDLTNSFVAEWKAANPS